MRYWIFQTKPENYPLIKELSEENVDGWRATQHASEIHRDDQVFLWQAGKEAGIYALATVTSEPRRTKNSDAYPVVTLKVDNTFIDRPLLRKTLLSMPGLENLSILRFWQGTNFPVTSEEWRILADMIDAPRVDAISEEGFQFADEAHLRAALARHLAQIEPGLVPYFDDRVEEYPVSNGRIDLLCRDKNGYAVVIELKRMNWGADKVVGQVAAYMGWARRELTEARGVRGILAVPNDGEVSSRLIDAISAVPGLELKRYSIRLTFESRVPGSGVTEV